MFLLVAGAAAQTAPRSQEEALETNCVWIAAHKPEEVAAFYGLETSGAVELVRAARQRCPGTPGTAQLQKPPQSRLSVSLADALAATGANASLFDGSWTNPAADVNGAGTAPGGAAVVPAPAGNPQPISGAELASSLRAIAAFTGDQSLARDVGKLDSARPEEIRGRLSSFSRQMERLRDRYAQFSSNPKKAREFERDFSGLAKRLQLAGMTPEEFFTVASAGPAALAARLRATASPEASASFSHVFAAVERIGDEELKLAKTEASVGLAKKDKAGAAAQVELAYNRAALRLTAALKEMADSGRISASQIPEFTRYGIDRLNAIREREIRRFAFPRNMALPIGGPAWEAGMDRILPPAETNQTMNVFVDGDQYYTELNGIIDSAYDKLFISMMVFEPDRPTLGITDDLSLKVLKARKAMTSLAVVNKIAAKKLEMPYAQYQLLRMKDHRKAKDIRDLRIAQELLKRENPQASAPDIGAPEVSARARTLRETKSDAQRKALVRQFFTRLEVKVILDGKFDDEAYLGQIWGLAMLGIDHSPSKWLMGIVSQMRTEAGTAVAAKANDAEWTRYLVDALGTPFRDIENKVDFLRHPLQYAFGVPRDLQDVGVDVLYENKIIDGHGVHPKAVLGNNHEKVVIARTEEGTLRLLTSGNHIGAKHVPEEGKPTPLVRWHDGGVSSEGGRESVAEDALRYELTRHWNDVAKKDPSRLITARQAESWMPTSDARVGDVSARLVLVEPGRERSAVAVVMSGLASVNKRVVIINPFFSGDEFIKQAAATADRWKLEGWDPRTPYDEKDPKSRQFIVVLPGWLDTGASQFASWKGIKTLTEHGITVLRWRPEIGKAATPDGKALYDRKAMLHTKAILLQSQTGDQLTGVAMLGSMSLTNPVFDGRHRELSVVSEDPRVIAEVDAKIVQPDLRNSVAAKPVKTVVAWFDRMVGLATKPFQ